MKPRIIKIDCDKWTERAYYCLKGLAIIGWALLTFGFLYAEYWIFTLFPIVKTILDYVSFFFVVGLIGLGNIANLYFVCRTIYNNQSLVKFECNSTRSKL